MEATLAGITAAFVVVVIMWLIDAASRKRELAEAQDCIIRKDCVLNHTSRQLDEKINENAVLHKRIGELTEATLGLSKGIDVEKAAADEMARKLLNLSLIVLRDKARTQDAAPAREPKPASTPNLAAPRFKFPDHVMWKNEEYRVVGMSKTGHCRCYRLEHIGFGADVTVREDELTPVPKPDAAPEPKHECKIGRDAKGHFCKVPA